MPIPDNTTPQNFGSVGAKADPAASSDTGDFSLISLFKRLLSRLTKGQANSAGSLPVVIASDQSRVAVSGKFSATTPSLSDGQTADLQVNTFGFLGVIAGSKIVTGSDGVSNTLLGGSFNAETQNFNTATMGRQAPFKFNGSTWDRQVKPSLVARLISAAASTNGTSVKGSAGNVFRIRGYNAAAALRYLKLYNKASAPTVGTDVPVLTIALPPTAAFDFDLGGADGHYFSAGIAYAITGAAADNDTTALTAGDVTALNITYS